MDILVLCQGKELLEITLTLTEMVSGFLIFWQPVSCSMLMGRTKLLVSMIQKFARVFGLVSVEILAL